jgi:hypothetical protein
MIVTLTPWEYIHAHDIGIRRTVANWNVSNKASYTAGNNQPEIIAAPAAAIAELAVAKALGRYWSGHVWDHSEHKRYKYLPDVEPNIEVRRVREQNNPVSVWEKDTGQNRILVATFPFPPEFRAVEILGFIPYDTAWKLGEARRGYRAVDQKLLKPIEQFEEWMKNHAQ